MYVSLRSDQGPRVSFQKGFVGTSGVTDSKSFVRPRKLRASRVTLRHGQSPAALSPSPEQAVTGFPEPLTSDESPCVSC